MEKPNILMVITHDTGRHLGCYGRGVETPNLDRLANDGVIFTNFFCTARGPGGFEGGRKVEALLSNVDFMPTILDLCDIPVPGNVQGKSMLPLIEGELEKLHDEVFVEQTYHAAYDPMRGARTEHYKYIRNYEKRPFWFPPNVDGGLSKEFARRQGYFDQPRPAEMLFDLAADPFEKRNLATDPESSDMLEEMRLTVDG